MTENEKIQRILESICSLPDNVSSIDTDKIDIDLPLPEINIAVRQLIANGDARDCTTQDNARTGSVGLLIIQATRDAFETKKYLKTDQENAHQRINIKADNIHLGDNFGEYSQSSSFDLKNKQKYNPLATSNNRVQLIIGIVSLVLMVVTIIVMILLDVF